MDLFKLLGTITINNSDANEALEETGQTAEKTKGKLSKAFSAVGKGAVAVGKTVGTGLLAGGAAMGALTVKAMNLSGELEQNMGGSEQVFKEYATKMQETAKNAFENMGLSTADFLGTANKMGALFQGAGFSIEESSNLASDAMQRAADVASIMGIDTSSAMEAIAGAAKGNFDMMDNLGVAMNDTTLNAYAMEKGINKTTQEMTNQEKIALAMEMFMEKTAYAAGNYAKENETLAGALGTAKSALTNFLDGSGDVDSLVSAFSNAANVIVDNLKEIAPRLISGVTDIINQIMPMLPPLLQELLPIIVEGAVSLINGLVSALPSIINALMSALPALIQGVQQIINALIQALPMIMQSLVSTLPTLIPMLVDALVSMIVMLCQMFPQIIQPIIDYLPDIIVAIVTALIDNLPALIDAGVQLLMGLLQGMISLVGDIPSVLSKIFEAIINGIKSLFGIHSPSKVMAGIGKNIVDGLINGVKSLLDKCSTVFKSLWSGIQNIFSNVGGWFSDKFTGAKEKIVSAFSDIKEKLSKPFTEARDKIKEIADKIKGFFKGDIDMPKIKKPSFAITPKGWKIGDLLEGVIPKLSIKWNAKGAVMKEPTLFGYNPATGTFQGGGEAGDEAIAPISTLQQYVSTAVASQNAGLIEILSKILEAILSMDENMGGHLREALNGVSIDMNKREFFRLVRGAI